MPLQTVLSTHCESSVQQPVMGVLTQPPAPMLALKSQVSAVQGELSLQSGGVPRSHCPVVRLQVSTPSQALHCASEVQQPPMGAWTQAPVPFMAVGSQLSAVHTMPSSQLGGVPETQSPVWKSQVSRPSQKWPLSQTLATPTQLPSLQA